MKQHIIIFFALLITFIDCDEYCNSKEKGVSKAKDCNTLKVDEESEEKYCCYLKGEYQGIEINRCNGLSEEEYKDIKGTIKTYESSGGKVKKLDCNSYYLKISLLSLIILFL